MCAGSSGTRHMEPVWEASQVTETHCSSILRWHFLPDPATAASRFRREELHRVRAPSTDLSTTYDLPISWGLLPLEPENGI